MANTSDIAVAIKRTPHEALTTAISKLPVPVHIPNNIERIIIKPSIYDPSLVGNTSLQMTEAVVRLFRKVSSISIVESDTPLRSAEDAFSKMGYSSKVFPDIEMFNLSSDTRVKMKMPGYFFPELEVPQILSNSPFIVNLATAKLSSNLSGIGASIKNLFGLIPEKMKSLYHEKIDDVLMDLLTIFTPNITIIDFTEIVIGNRSENKTKNVGGVVVGIDPVSVDAFCADLFGLDPLSVPHIRRAHELGLGIAIPERIKVHGTEHQKEIFSKIGKQYLSTNDI